MAIIGWVNGQLAALVILLPKSAGQLVAKTCRQNNKVTYFFMYNQLVTQDKNHLRDWVAMDILDMSVTTPKGNRYILLMVDFFSMMD